MCVFTRRAGYEECFKRVEEAKTATPVRTAELEEIRDIYGYDLYIDCLNAVISKHNLS